MRVQRLQHILPRFQALCRSLAGQVPERQSRAAGTIPVGEDGGEQIKGFLPVLLIKLLRADEILAASQCLNWADEAIRYINTSKPIKTIPRLFACSPETLMRTFRRRTGINTTEYRYWYNYKSSEVDKEKTFH